MMPARIYETRRGLLVKATARDFPSLADLAPFIDLRPLGLAADVATAIGNIRTVGRAA